MRDIRGGSRHSSY